MENGPSEVLLKRDSVLGVALDIYEWHNVKAELTLSEPDTADHNVLLYTRTADYTATGEYIGSLVVDGEEKQSDVSRLGYCALKTGTPSSASRASTTCVAPWSTPTAPTSASLSSFPTANSPRASPSTAKWSAKPSFAPPTTAFASSPRATPNPLELCRRLARIRLRRCHLSHRR